MGNAEYHETETHIYHLDTGIIFPLRKKNYATKEEALASLQETRISMWKDPIQIQKVMEKQPSIHSKLLKILLGDPSIEEDTRVITMN